ncbi:hypothetical protein ACSBR2_016619 [Camellia fascicularis]
MNVPMHCLGFALSPRFYDSIYKERNEDKEMVAGVLKAFEKIASHLEETRMLHKQFVDFHMRKGLFSTIAAFVDASTIGAIEWWATYGSETPELPEVARKEKNWSTYSYIHNVKRNRLNASQADKLVFIHSNIRLLSRFQENYREGPFKKWDVNSEDTTIDGSQVRLEEMGWQSLEDAKDDTQQEHSHLDERNQEQTYYV